MKEIFTKIWKFLWERTGRKELDSDEIWLLERMDRIAAIEEPDYDRMWERIRRKTICKNSPRVKLWRGVAAVALPMAVICTAVYFFREKTQQPSGQFLVENQKETSSRISLTLGNGKVLKIPKDSVGEVLKTGQVAVHQDSLKGIVSLRPNRRGSSDVCVPVWKSTSFRKRSVVEFVLSIFAAFFRIFRAFSYSPL